MARSAKTKSKKVEPAPKNRWHGVVSFAMLLKDKWYTKILTLWLTPFLILESFFFSEVLKGHNYLETFPKELIFPLALHGVTASLIAVLVYVVKKPRSFAAKLTAATFLGLLMVDYDERLMGVVGWFKAILPVIPQPGDDVALISLLFLVLLGVLALWLGRWIERLQSRHEQLSTVNIVAGILIVVGFIFGSQAVRVMQVLPSVVNEAAVQPAALPRPKEASRSTDKPDIYYIVFDRYTSNSVLKEQFSFDNSQFTGYLRTNGFSVDDDAYSNYPYTAASMASTMNGTYIDDYAEPFKNKEVQSRTLFHSLTRQSSVAQALKDAGYEYHGIGSTYGSTSKVPLAEFDYMSANTIFFRERGIKQLRGLEVSQFKQSPYYRFTKISGVPGWPVSSAEVDDISYIREQFNRLDQLAAVPEAGGRFIMAHLLIPHDPFYFNADGTLSARPANNGSGRPVKEKYVEQIKFVNNQIQSTVDTILKNSNGQAVIMLISDEGAYPRPMSDSFRTPVSDAATIQELLTADMSQWTDEWLRMKFGILEAVHIPKATSEDLQQVSSVNAFRIVLNRYLGYELDYLPQCHFAFNKGGLNEFNFADITKRLAGADNAYCADRQSLPKS